MDCARQIDFTTRIGSAQKVPKKMFIHVRVCGGGELLNEHHMTSLKVSPG